ncbi:EF-hand domain-containing protein [Reyranella sp.]|uniref:EF-hand domain-containing protein n=1 Tax=Reyranella sp. TaxID=1929291 RepID=UPI002730A1EC|nr:EF-hand domain-containing protein [Reyranella sp.]MDP2372927.1 EF-hand domain-containing protein [Reyranella sp.]
MNRFLVPILLAAAAAMTLPVSAQTPPPSPSAPNWPANRPAQAAPPAAQPPAAQRPGTPPAAAAPPAGQTATTGAAPPPVPLPSWFAEIDVNKKGEVTRADFLKYRMKSFEQLDVNKDGKLTVEEFLKVVEPPLSPDGPNKPPLEELRTRARSEFQNLDTNRDGFVERAEAEALVHAEFNQYDTDRDNKITEPEVRLIVQRSMQREATERQQIEARRRQGMVTVNEFIDMQLRNADQLDKNNDVKVSQQEYLALAGPADGPQAKNLLPFDLRKQIALRKFAEIDTNKDNQLDRVELTAYAVKQFLEMDLNKDRFLSEEEFKKAQEAESKKIQALVQAMQPATPPQPRPAPAQPRGAQPAPQPAPGLAPGLPQGTR